MARTFSIAAGMKQDVLTLLKAARDYIKGHPKQWTTDAFAYDQEGNPCSAASPAAKQFCALGFAIDRAADLFGVRSFRITEKNYLSEGYDRNSIGRLVWRLSPEAERIYRKGIDALDRATEALHDGADTVAFNDYHAEGPREIVAIYDAAIELVNA